jgi:hypothetical protein
MVAGSQHGKGVLDTLAAQFLASWDDSMHLVHFFIAASIGKNLESQSGTPLPQGAGW